MAYGFGNPYCLRSHWWVYKDERAVLGKIPKSSGLLALILTYFVYIHHLPKPWPWSMGCWIVPPVFQLLVLCRILASAGWSCSTLGLPKQLAQRISWGQKLGSSVAIELPASAELMHLGQLCGFNLVCSSSSWGSLQRRHCLGSVHLWVRWPRLQHLLHWVTGGRSWKALTEQCFPKAARDLYERISLAVFSSVSAKTRDDLCVVRSSSSVQSQRGLDAMIFWAIAYIGLQLRSSVWISSGGYTIRFPPTVSVPVFTPSIWILNHFLSSRSMVLRLPSRLCRVGIMMSLCWRSSSAVWSALVEMIRLPLIGREIVYARILQFSIYYFRNFEHFAPFNRSYSRCLRKDWSRNGSLRLPLIKTK